MVSMGDQDRGPVLVAEDDPSIRELLLETLRGEGIAAVAAGDGDEAIRLALEKRPALVLLDLGLPLLHGSLVAAKIREAYGDAVPLVVITAAARTSDTARSVLGATHIAKPFDVEDLLRAVRLALDPPRTLPEKGTAPSVA